MTDGKYQADRFKEIVRERYLLTKNTSTSYEEAGKLTPIERRYLLGFLQEEADRLKEAAEKRQQARKQSSSTPTSRNKAQARSTWRSR